ncbi:hypothetical protein [Thermoactinospora rubra]|uniref:hypothetical protein n=1 Tax=Thermoactinospora rubra TaxID=1088767 RepID=UPI000A0FFFAF|nr:hypothetical protein [Thermoactinospora rubra]
MTAVFDAFRAERATTSRPRPPRTPYTVRAARWLARRLPRWHTIRTLTLSTAGFGLLTAAAWTLHIAAGLAAAGISLLVLEALSGGDRR